MRKILFTDFTLTDAIYRCTCGQTISLGNGQLNPKDGRRIEVIPDGCAKCNDKWLKYRLEKAVRLGELIVAFRNDIDIKSNVRVGEV